MKPAPPVTRRRIGRKASRRISREAGAKPVAPVRELRRAGSLAAQDGVRRPRRRTLELRGRDAPHARVEARLLEDRLREVGPRAVAVRGDVPEARAGGPRRRARAWPRRDGRRRSGLPRWSSTTATSSRSAPSRSIVRRKLCPVEPKSQEVRTTHASVTGCRLAVELRPAVRGQRVRPVRLDVRRALAPVEDVVGRVRHERRARARRRSPCPPTFTAAAPCGSASAPSTSVQAAVCRTRSNSPCDSSCRSAAGRRPSRRASARERRPSANACRSAWPSWPPAPVIRTRRRRRAPTGSACSSSIGVRRAGRSRRSCARRGRPGRTRP